MLDVEFNWNEDDSIVIRKMDAVAVYQNPHGQIVIRQENEYGDGDSMIVLNVDGARILAAALVCRMNKSSSLMRRVALRRS